MNSKRPLSAITLNRVLFFCLQIGQVAYANDQSHVACEIPGVYIYEISAKKSHETYIDVVQNGQTMIETKASLRNLCEQQASDYWETCYDGNEFPSGKYCVPKSNINVRTLSNDKHFPFVNDDEKRRIHNIKFCRIFVETNAKCEVGAK